MLNYVFFKSCHHRSRWIANVCKWNVLNISATYAAILGVLGVILSLYQIVQIMVCGPKLPCNLLTTLKSTRLIGSGTERDLRLISLVLSMEYYMLLVVGTVLVSGNNFIPFRNGVFFLPWLIFYSIVICLEFLLFVSRSCSDGIIIKKQSAVLAIFVVYNWLAIFCAFLQINGGHC